MCDFCCWYGRSLDSIWLWAGLLFKNAPYGLPGYYAAKAIYWQYYSSCSITFY